jgi:hypothetical protein
MAAMLTAAAAAAAAVVVVIFFFFFFVVRSTLEILVLRFAVFEPDRFGWFHCLDPVVVDELLVYLMHRSTEQMNGSE